MEQQIYLVEVIGFKLGVLPVRYLGLPLITGKIRREYCKPLVDKIVSRITSWTSRFLSFAGRVQLISAVLSSMYNYWCNIFLLP